MSTRTEILISIGILLNIINLIYSEHKLRGEIKELKANCHITETKP